MVLREGRIRHVQVLIGALFFAVTLALFIYFGKRELPPPVDPLYLKENAGTNERIEDLISHMTLEEKIGQMALVEKNSISPEDVVEYGIGAILSGAGGKPEENTEEGWKRMVEDFDAASRNTRLKIPMLYGVDANHGHGNVPGATVFPHFIGLGASGDPALVEAVARATRDELLATGIYWSFSPTLDLPEDIRWGRVYEAFSDDPGLSGRLGAAYVRGLQENGNETISVLATPKHFIGAGAMLWNTSSNEDYRLDQGTTPPSEEKLRETYLPPFEAAIRAGAMSVMVGLNSWGETKLSAEKFLITDVLKGDLAFEGFVVSDWYGVYEIPGGKYTAAVTAINAGVDMVMLPFEYETFIRDVARAVSRGDISESRINDAVRRILRAKFALGLFERENDASGITLGSSERRSLARRSVSESLVLLKNESGTLPIEENSRIFVAGSAAHNIGKQMGAWTVEWQGIDGNWLQGATSILDGIRNVAGENAEIEYAENGIFAPGALADIGIAVVGESPYAEGWGDSPNPTLSNEDQMAIDRLSERSEQVVVILVTGRPLIIADEIGDWDALVVAWLPGSEGGGVADVLFGRTGFTGSLPLPWPQSTDQLPIETDGTTRDGTEPLFPRYFGLTY